MKAVFFAALLVVGCTNPNYKLVTGQVTTVEFGVPCFVTIQDPDPLVRQGPSRFEVDCTALQGVVPGDRWPPR